MPPSVDTSLPPKAKGIAKNDAQPSQGQPIPGQSAHGIATINVLSTAISRGKPPADPQTRSDFCFDRLLSFLPHDEHKLLRVYKALDVPSSTLRKWASRGRKRLGEKVLARLKQRQDAAPDEYQFAVDHLYAWGLGNGRDAWARAGQEYDRKLKGEPQPLPEQKEAAKQTAALGTFAEEAQSSQIRESPESSRKRNRNAFEITANVTSENMADIPEVTRPPKMIKKTADVSEVAHRSKKAKAKAKKPKKPKKKTAIPPAPHRLQEVEKIKKIKKKAATGSGPSPPGKS